MGSAITHLRRSDADGAASTGAAGAFRRARPAEVNREAWRTAGG